jgi:hypothetical protein
MLSRWTLAATLLLISSCGDSSPRVWRNEALCREGDPALLEQSDGRSELETARAEVARLEREMRMFDALLSGRRRFAEPGSQLDRIELDELACIREHAFKLAPAPDDAEVIARAVAHICRTHAAQYANSAAEGAGDLLPVIRALHAREMENMAEDALVDVLRARAGHCYAPDPPS